MGDITIVTKLSLTNKTPARNVPSRPPYPPRPTQRAAEETSVEAETNQRQDRSALTTTPLAGKRKRGRPRKYSDDGRHVLPAKPKPAQAPPALSADGKKKRGRPKGTGRLQLLASLGPFAVDTAGGSFTPHITSVPIGADVVSWIISFAQKGPRAVCILSAVGELSAVTIRQPSGILTHEVGQFEILTLTGTYVFAPRDGRSSSKRKSDRLSVSLAKPDGTVFGGSVGGPLIVSRPIQLIVGSFKQDIGSQLRRKFSSEAASPVAAAASAVATSSAENGGAATNDGGAAAANPVMIHPPSTFPNVNVPPQSDDSIFCHI